MLCEAAALDCTGVSGRVSVTSHNRALHVIEVMWSST
jgi:hypothetical protein